MSFKTAVSSIASANSFFSFPFSSSSAFSRLASETSRPPNLALHCKTSLQKFRACGIYPPSSPRILLAQDPYDLLLAEPASLHRPSPLSDGLYPRLGGIFGVQVSGIVRMAWWQCQ